MPFQAPRGTQDVLPADSAAWQWVEREFLALALLYGYQEIRTPVFEDEKVFTRTSGETSEVVTKQMYNFRDKGGREICLKPEQTAPSMRAAIEHNLCPPGTVCRLSYIAPFYRYERPQMGRLREAHQAGLEVIGSPSVEADAEILEVTVRFFERLGLKELKVRLNSLGREQCRTGYRAALLAHAAPYVESQDEAGREKILKNPLRLLDSKDEELRSLMETAPSILDYLEDECQARFEELQCLLDDAGISYEVDPRIVRGLDYYTETVFEVQSEKLGAQSSLCGGGRYDHLSRQLGGPDIPSVGVGIGVERLLMVLGGEGLLPMAPAPDVLVAFAGRQMRKTAANIARELRKSGLKTLAVIDDRSLKAQFKQADRAGATYVVVVGEEELADNKVLVRELSTGEERTIPLDGIAQALEQKWCE